MAYSRNDLLSWKILQARYALCLLFEYAATLGLIDVAYIPPHGARPDYGNLWGVDDLSFFSRYDNARLIECADAVMAALIANDSRTQPFCLRAGERHLVVPAESEARFRSALRKVGYSLPK
jgi:hypothetical protein